MEHMASCLPNSFQLVNSQYNGTKSAIKNKNMSTSSQRKNQNLKVNVGSSKTKSHTRENSNMRKSKSKCQTQVNYSGKKKKLQYENSSKKTIPKKKKPINLTATVNNQLLRNSNKIAETNRFSRKRINKQKQQSIILKNKKSKQSKQIFHSTCFSRNFDIDNIGLSSPNGHTSVFCPSSECVDHIDNAALDKIYDKTKQVIGVYRKKCETLDQNCQYYQQQLNKALQEIKMLKKSTNDPKQSKHIEQANKLNTISLKKSSRKNRTNTDFMRNSKSKNSCHRDNSQLL